MAVLGLDRLKFKADPQDVELHAKAVRFESARQVLAELGATAALHALEDEIEPLPPCKWLDTCTVTKAGILVARSSCIALPSYDGVGSTYFGVVAPALMGDLDTDDIHSNTDFSELFESKHGDIHAYELTENSAGLIVATGQADSSGFSNAKGYLFTGEDRIVADEKGYMQLCELATKTALDALPVSW